VSYIDDRTRVYEVLFFRRLLVESVLQSKVIFFALTVMSTSLKCAP
jgi:hypothetical protein